MTEEYIDRNRLSLIPAFTRSVDTHSTMGKTGSPTADGPSISTILHSLDDSKCRAIISALERPCSATELCETCDLPRSTVYRKLERLSEADLIRKYTEIRSDGPNATLYERDFTAIRVGIDDAAEFTVTVERPESDATDKMATFWSEMKKES